MLSLEEVAGKFEGASVWFYNVDDEEVARCGFASPPFAIDVEEQRLVSNPCTAGRAKIKARIDYALLVVAGGEIPPVKCGVAAIGTDNDSNPFILPSLDVEEGDPIVFESVVLQLHEDEEPLQGGGGRAGLKKPEIKARVMVLRKRKPDSCYSCGGELSRRIHSDLPEPLSLEVPPVCAVYQCLVCNHWEFVKP